MKRCSTSLVIETHNKTIIGYHVTSTSLANQKSWLSLDAGRDGEQVERSGLRWGWSLYTSSLLPDTQLIQCELAISHHHHEYHGNYYVLIMKVWTDTTNVENMWPLFNTAEQVHTLGPSDSTSLGITLKKLLYPNTGKIIHSKVVFCRPKLELRKCP